MQNEPQIDYVEPEDSTADYSKIERLKREQQNILKQLAETTDASRYAQLARQYSELEYRMEFKGNRFRAKYVSAIEKTKFNDSARVLNVPTTIYLKTNVEL